MITHDRTNLIISAAAIIIILVLGWLLIARHRAQSGVLGKTDVVATSSIMTSNLTIQDQSAGSSVKVTSMDLSKASWVAIKEDSGGRILGAGWFPAGATSGTVPLLRSTMKGGKYEGLVYVDNGDKKFELHTDTLLEGVSAAFSAQ